VNKSFSTAESHEKEYKFDLERKLKKLFEMNEDFVKQRDDSDGLFEKFKKNVENHF